MTFTTFIVLGSSFSLFFFLRNAEKDRMKRDDFNQKLKDDGKDELVDAADAHKTTKK